MDAHNAANSRSPPEAEVRAKRDFMYAHSYAAGFPSRVRATINLAVCACVHRALRAVVNIVTLETAGAVSLFLYHLLT